MRFREVLTFVIVFHFKYTSIEDEENEKRLISERENLKRGNDFSKQQINFSIFERFEKGKEQAKERKAVKAQHLLSVDVKKS